MKPSPLPSTAINLQVETLPPKSTIKSVLFLSTLATTTYMVQVLITSDVGSSILLSPSLHSYCRITATIPHSIECFFPKICVLVHVTSCFAPFIAFLQQTPGSNAGPCIASSPASFPTTQTLHTKVPIFLCSFSTGRPFLSFIPISLNPIIFSGELLQASA